MSEIFWSTISSYNQNTWIIQILICVVGFILTALVYLKPTARIKLLLKVFLAFSFAWISIMFFIVNGSTELNKYLTATLFGIISLLFLIDIFRNQITFERNRKYDKAALLLYILFASYPLISIILGHKYPAITTWLMPCPLTVYSITLLISFSIRINYGIFLLLIIWALTGLPKIFIFSVPEDIILFISGILAILVGISTAKENKITSKKFI